MDRHGIVSPEIAVRFRCHSQWRCCQITNNAAEKDSVSVQARFRVLLFLSEPSDVNQGLVFFKVLYQAWCRHKLEKWRNW